MSARLHRLWHGIRYGSPEGPAIKIDWDTGVVEMHRMSGRLAARVIRWIDLGEDESRRVMGGHGGGRQG